MKLQSDLELVMRSIKKVADLFLPKQKLCMLTQDDICRQLITFGLPNVLAELIPSLVRSADDHYRHGANSSAISESFTENVPITEHNRSEKYLERAFDLLFKLLQVQSQDVRSSLVRSSLFSQQTL